MSKTTTLSVERDLPAALRGFKQRASAVKEAHSVASQAIREDPLRSDLAKSDDHAALTKKTRDALASIRGEQDSYVKNLRDKIEREFRGDQPADAASVVSRRDAADRARKVTDRREAKEMLHDAIANGDADLAHAIGTKARNSAWLDVAEAYQAAHPETADSAGALAYVEANTSGGPYNLSNSITFATPSD
jgi:hypothetical protein